MRPSEFAQKQVGEVARLADVVKHGGAAQLAGVVDHQIAEAEQPLRNTGGDGDVLNFGEGYVARGARDQSGIDLHF